MPTLDGEGGPVAAPRPPYAVLVFVALSTPLALLVETGLRALILPPEFEEVRGWLGPAVTPWAWALVPTVLAATALGVVVLRRLIARAQARPVPEGVPPEQALARGQFDALMLSSSVPQVPALAATILFMLGAELIPVLLAIVLATAGVVSLGFVFGRNTDAASASD